MYIYLLSKERMFQMISFSFYMFLSKKKSHSNTLSQLHKHVLLSSQCNWLGSNSPKSFILVNLGYNIAFLKWDFKFTVQKKRRILSDICYKSE